MAERTVLEKQLQKLKPFIFYYNKPESEKLGKPQITLRFNSKRYLLDNIVINVLSRGKLRKDQPRFVIGGRAEFLHIENNIGYLS